MDKLIDILLKLGVVAALLIAAATDQQYSYYDFVRWVNLGTSLYFAYKAFGRGEMGLVIYFVLCSILFNPFKPFWFQRETWQLIDYIVSFITCGTIYNDLFGDKPKEHKVPLEE